MNLPHLSSGNQSRVRLSLWWALSAAMLLGSVAATQCQAAGTILAWGANESGQLLVPPRLTNVVAIAAGAAHSVALREDGTVSAWGLYVSGQTNVPPGLSGVTAISAGATFTMALKSNGTVVEWGNIAPVPAGLTKVRGIAAGWAHALALLNDQTVISWGSQTTVPPGLENIVAIAAGNEQSLALKADGSVVAWGDGSFGKTNVPAGLTNVIAIAAGADHCLALQRDGTVIAWGRNDDGQTTIPPGLRAVAVGGGARHSLALRTDGTLAAWGDNTYNQTVVNPSDSGFVAISAGGYHNLAIKGDGHVFILLPPASQSVFISKDTTFQVIATGTQPLTYQWQHYGTNLPGATTSALALQSVQATDGGPYNVIVGNVFGSVTSPTALLTAFGGAPIVVAAPQDQTVICGDTASLQLSVGGSSPFTFQWQFQGTNIDQATNATLLLTNVTPAAAGPYTVTAQNPFGLVTTGAVLTVAIEPPALTSPLTAAGVQGSPFTYVATALHNPISFSARYLPAGLLLDTNTGVISGLPAESGVFGPQITAINACSSDTETVVLDIAPTVPTITSPAQALGTEGQPFTYQITATASPIRYGGQNLPAGLSVDPLTGLISGNPTYAGSYDSTIWASNLWAAGYANLHFDFANAAIDNINIGNVTYNYSKPYLLDFQFSLFTIKGDTNDPTSPTEGVVVNPKLLSAICMEDSGLGPVTNSPTETGSFVVQGSSKVVKIYLVLDFTESIASIPANGDTNNNGVSDAVDFMVAGAQDFVNQQPFDTQIGVYEFHRDDQSPSNVVSLTTDKVLLNQSIAGIYTNYVKGFSSGSRCWDALSAAVGKLGASNRDEQHYVVFVSDGRDESSTTTMTNAMNAATAAAVKIFAIGFGGELDAVPLQTLASLTSGGYFAAGNDPSALADQFAAVSKSAKGQYILRWATLKRSSTVFMPSFIINYAGLTAVSPTNPVSIVITNDPADTNTPPATITNYVTNFIIAPYKPTDYAGPPAVGSVRFSPNTQVLPTAIDFRATYVPRDIHQIRVHYRANWPCTTAIQSTGPGEMLDSWSLSETNDGAGGKWMLLSSPDPRLSIPFASFGKLVTFKFSDAITASSAFALFAVDNTLYTNTGSQSFTNENASSFVTAYPALPNGTPVPWLLSYGLSTNASTELLDTDGDGVPNWQEYRANTNPTNAASKFVIRSVSKAVDGRFQITFSASTNRVYRLDSSLDLVTWQTVQDNIPGLNQDLTVTDTFYEPGDTVYYRILVH